MFLLQLLQSSALLKRVKTVDITPTISTAVMCPHDYPTYQSALTVVTHMDAKEEQECEKDELGAKKIATSVIWRYFGLGMGTSIRVIVVDVSV